MKLPLKTYTVEQLSQLQGQINRCEAQIRRRLKSAARGIIDRGAKLILVAGPSCSCKTSSTMAIDALLEEAGVGSSEISMDDYYKNREDCPLLEDGKMDTESPAAYDMELLNFHLTELMENRAVDLPLFDFPTASRKKETKRMTPTENGVIILEGINALNPIIATEIPAQKVCRVFVCPMAEVACDGEIVLSARDLRFIRRTVRDKFFRGNGVERTMAMWPTVAAAEEKYIFPYVENADIVINTFHPFELSVFKKEMLGCLPKQAGDYAKLFSNISGVMSRLGDISTDMLPENSLLHEFIK